MRVDQQGSVLLEALLAILIFSIGILALVGMQATTINNVADAKYRADASFLADQIVGEMWAKRIPDASGVLRLDPAFACNSCTTLNGNSETQAWVGVNGISGALPQGKGSITISGVDEVTVTVEWQPPQASGVHRHTVVTPIF